MDKLISKWYFGLIIIPIFINYLTNYIQLPYLLNNWVFTIIGVFIIIILILFYELIKLKKENKQTQFKPKDIDIKIITELIDTLDINCFHDKIKNQNSWYGYEREAIIKMINFAEKANLICYRAADKKLNKYIEELRNSIDDFNNYSKNQLYPDGNFYSPAKDTEFNIKKAKIASPIMNKKSDVVFNKLVDMMTYLKVRNYLQ